MRDLSVHPSQDHSPGSQQCRLGLTLLLAGRALALVRQEKPPEGSMRLLGRQSTVRCHAGSARVVTKVRTWDTRSAQQDKDCHPLTSVVTHRRSMGAPS